MDSFHRNSHYSPPYHENFIPQPSYCQYQSPAQVVYSLPAQNFDPPPTPLIPRSLIEEIKDMLLGLQRKMDSWDMKVDENHEQ